MTLVRPAEPRDAAALTALVQEMHVLHATALPGVFQPPASTITSPDEVTTWIASPGRVWLVAERDGTVVGYAHAEVQIEPPTAYKRASRTLHVHAIGVTASLRGRGSGGALLAALRRTAAERALVGLTLEVYAFNAGARRFYEREGFTLLRERLVAPVDPRG